jgi:hypothetical protein
MSPHLDKLELDMACTHLAAGADICLPNVCEVYCVKATDTINSIVAGPFRQESVPQFVAWNVNFNAMQRSENMTPNCGEVHLCESPGTLQLPGTSLRPATTAVYVPRSSTACA